MDCGEIPDAAMTLAVIALFAEGPTAIRNVYSWRVKETERMKAIVNELTKLGASVSQSVRLITHVLLQLCTYDCYLYA